MEPGIGGGTDDESEEESAVSGARLMVCRYLRLVGVAYVEDVVVAGVALADVRVRRACARVVLKEIHLVARLKWGALLTCRAPRS